MRKLMVFMGLMLVLSNVARADIFFEPYFGSVMSGKLSGELFDTLEDDTGNDIDGKANGNGYGARLAYQFINVMFGVDYMGSNGKTDGDTSTFSATGAYIGFAIPMIRFWAEYIFSSTIKSEGESDGVDTAMVLGQGSGSKIGIGWSPIPYLSINLEMINVTYKTFSFKQDGKEVAKDNNWDDLASNLNMTFLSVSVPI